MARSHARLGTDIWAEDSIRNHTRDGQRAYFLVLSQPELSRCGVLPFRLKRLANLAVDDSPAKLRKAFKSLEKTRHLILDEDAEELLVRTFVRHDGLLRQPQMVAAMVTDFALIESWKIRGAFLAELRRIWDHPRTTDDDRKGLRLALGEHETDRYVDRIGPALGPSMAAAIEAGSVPPFDPGCKAGCPAPFAQGRGKALAGAPARSPAPTPSPTPAPSSPPTGQPHDDDTTSQLLDEHLTVAPPLSAGGRKQLAEHITAQLDRATPEQMRDVLSRYRDRMSSGQKTLPGLIPLLVDDVLADSTDDDPLAHPEAQAFLAAHNGARR